MKQHPSACPRCEKSPSLCVCSSVQPRETELHVLILQHPQEPDKHLGSARLAHLSLPNSTLKIGLSWPNIKKALGRETIPSRWAVLHLGSGIKGSPPQRSEQNPVIHFVDKGGKPTSAPQEPLEGIILLDGTWSQAKTLWWRNAWLLKCKRVILTPRSKSLYKELRKEPRRECLSTIESLAECLTALGESAETEKQLKSVFAELLNKQRERLKKQKTSASSESAPTSPSQP
jgi:DTW domain-containing protein YfiP